jgi:hypothetical protein
MSVRPWQEETRTAKAAQERANKALMKATGVEATREADGRAGGGAGGRGGGGGGGRGGGARGLVGFRARAGLTLAGAGPGPRSCSS